MSSKILRRAAFRMLSNTPECLTTFSRMFGNIPQNIWGHSPGFSRICLRMFQGIPWYVWWHSPVHNIPPFPAFPHLVPRSCILGFTHSQELIGKVRNTESSLLKNFVDERKEIAELKDLSEELSNSFTCVRPDLAKKVPNSSNPFPSFLNKTHSLTEKTCYQ